MGGAGKIVDKHRVNQWSSKAILMGSASCGTAHRQGCLLRIFLGAAAPVADFVGEFCNGFIDGHDLLFLRPEPPHSDGLFVYFALSHGQQHRRFCDAVFADFVRNRLVSEIRVRCDTSITKPGYDIKSILICSRGNR